MHITVTIYHTIISKFQNFKKFKNSPIVKKSTSQVSDIMLDACMQFENYPMKTVGEEAFYNYYILYHYFKISKIQKYSDRQKSTNQVSDIMLDACVQCENYQIKTVGEEAFYSYYILYHYFKISKIRQKFKNSPIVKKSTTQVSDIILDTCMQYEKYLIKTVGGEAFYNYILYDYFKISKIRQKFKNSPIIKKSTTQVSNIILDICMQYENYPIKTVGEEAFYSCYIIYHYFKISKIRQKFKNSSIVKKAQAR